MVLQPSGSYNLCVKIPDQQFLENSEQPVWHQKPCCPSNLLPSDWLISNLCYQLIEQVPNKVARGRADNGKQKTGFLCTFQMIFQPVPPVVSRPPSLPRPILRLALGKVHICCCRSQRMGSLLPAPPSYVTHLVNLVTANQ